MFGLSRDLVLLTVACNPTPDEAVVTEADEGLWRVTTVRIIVAVVCAQSAFIHVCEENKE